MLPYVFGANEVYTRYFEHTGAMAKLSSVLQTSLVVWTGRWGIPTLRCRTARSSSP